MSDNSITRKIPQITRLDLPVIYPANEAMKSYNQNIHFYHPDLWELEYSTYRYLNRIPESDLIERYHSIIRNMRAYPAGERNKIPINNYQSSWYWYRKEHHTRLEIAYREIDQPQPDIQPQQTNMLSLNQASIPNGSDRIFRYSKLEYMKDMVAHGNIRVSPASSYADTNLNIAQKDEELEKHAYMPGQYTTITHESGKAMKVIGDVKRSVSGPPYHLVCFSNVWDKQLFSDFEADTCCVVENPEEFSNRLERAGASLFPNWYYLNAPVQYFDPYERVENELFNSSMSKDFRFAYQHEYRILWSQMNEVPINRFQEICIGPAQDIMRLLDACGNKIQL